jgi:hypothetical protein
MSDYNWCHGTSCHKSHTQDRVRGSKGSKVLRTRKIKQTEWNKSPFGQGGGSTWAYFCSQGCLMDFMRTHIQQIVSIAPRTEPLETPIEVKTETRQDYYGRDYEHKIMQELGVDTAD